MMSSLCISIRLCGVLTLSSIFYLYFLTRHDRRTCVYAHNVQDFRRSMINL